MIKSDFSEIPCFSTLPRTVSVFPLAGALLLPGGFLPLNIFEKRYLDMVRDAMNNHRLIVMCQPRDTSSERLYDIVSLGYIRYFEEIVQDRIVITLKGVCRGRLLKELFFGKPWRIFEMDWKEFEDDFQIPLEIDIDRQKLIHLVRSYFEKRNISANWSALELGNNEVLIIALSMICPFEVSEKQALLESKTVEDRAKILFSLLTMSSYDIFGYRNLMQ